MHARRAEVPETALPAPPLSVVRAEARKDPRPLRPSKVERAGFLAGPVRGATTVKGAVQDVRLGSDQLLGLGSARRSLDASGMAEETATRKVAQFDRRRERHVAPSRKKQLSAKTPSAAERNPCSTGQTSNPRIYFRNQYDAAASGHGMWSGVYENITRASKQSQITL